jgi:WD40 repeat protein
MSLLSPALITSLCLGLALSLLACRPTEAEEKQAAGAALALLSQEMWNDLPAQTGAKARGQTIEADLEKIRKQPEVLASWEPWFLPLPADPAVKAKLQELNARAQARLNQIPSIKEEGWATGAAFGYLREYLEWQYGLASEIKVLQSLGRSQADAWVEVLESPKFTADESGYIKKLSPLPPAKLVTQGNYHSFNQKDVYNVSGVTKDFYAPLFILAERGVLISQRPSGLVAYEMASGRELWRNQAQAEPGNYWLIRDLLVVNEYVTAENSQSKVMVIDTQDGRTVFEMDFVNDGRLGLAQDSRCMAIAADTKLFVFSLLEDRAKKGWIKEISLNLDGYAEEKTKSILLNKAVSEYGIVFPDLVVEDDSAFFALSDKETGIVLDRPGDEAPPLFIWGEQKLNGSQALALDHSGAYRYSIWSGPESQGPFGGQEVIWLDRIAKTAQALQLANDDNLTLTTNVVRKQKYEGDPGRFEIAFSPNGAANAVADVEGNVHFFHMGRYIDSVQGDSAVGKKPGRRLKDFEIQSIVTDSEPERPICALLPRDKSGQGLVVRFDLAKGTAETLPDPAPQTSVAITAFSLSSANEAALGLEDGSLWMLNLNSGQLRRLPQAAGLWSALNFSPDGAWLVGADSSGQVYLWTAKQEESQAKLLFKAKSPAALLAVTDNGQKVWALENPPEYDHPSLLSFWSPKSGVVASEVAPERAEGSDFIITGLTYDQTRDEAQILAMERNYGSGEETSSKTFEIPYRPQQKTIPLRSTQATLTTLEIDSSALLATFSQIADVCALNGFSPDMNSHFVQFSLCTGGSLQYWIDLHRDQVVFVTLEGGELENDADDGTLNADRSLTAFGARNSGHIFINNAETGHQVALIDNTLQDTMGLRSVKWLSGQPRLLALSNNGVLRLWDISKPQPANLLSWVFLKNGAPVAIGQDYRFDTPDIDQVEEGIHWVVSRLPDQTLALPVLWRDYYQPRLAEYVLAGKKLPELPSIDRLNLNQHGIKLVGVEPEKDAPDRVAVILEIYVRGKDPNHPAQELKLFRDGQLVGKYAGENNGLFDLPDGKRQVTFHNIALPRHKNQVRFKAWAFNNDGVRSKYFDRPYDYKPQAKAAPKLHLVSMGVNNFDNPAWDLKYAANDAKGYADILPTRLAGVNTDVRLLASGEGLTKPSKENLKATLQTLAAGGSSPDDVVVLAVSSHGLTDDKDNKFYIIPADIPGQEKRVTPELLARSISADELGDWLTGVDAAEIVMILDTCQSGAALGGESFKPGPMGDKGLGQMAYDKAMRVLSATNENNAAMELGDLGHGLLSYALLVDGLERGLAGSKSGFTFKDWLKYGQERTTELYAKIAKGESIGETRGKVKVDKTSDNANPPLGQEPYLFDFGGDDQEVIRFRSK